MVDRLKGTLKEDLVALQGGTSMSEEAAANTPKKAATPRKRKTKADGDKATPTKRGRGKKAPVSETQVEDDEESFTVKEEIKDDDGEEQI
jgi:hypothetical protein